MTDKTVTVDVREDLKRGRDVFGRIMLAANSLAPDQNLLLIAPFEPVPLFGVLAMHGFAHQARQTPSGDWEILFSRGEL
jgi:hypothetical protein